MNHEPSRGDFIEVFHDALPREACEALIRRFEASGQAQPGRVGSGVIPAMKDSSDICISAEQGWKDAESQLNTALIAALEQYLKRYCYTLIAPLSLMIPDPATGQPRALLPEDFETFPPERLRPIIMAAFRPGSINIQRYTANKGGYPYWHCEHYPKDAQCDALHRVLLWTVYLNDAFDEGETEFLYQSRKIQPRTGSLLIAPAFFTHTHRGNMPKNGDKYIATSWVLFQRAEALFRQR